MGGVLQALFYVFKHFTFYCNYYFVVTFFVLFLLLLFFFVCVEYFRSMLLMGWKEVSIQSENDIYIYIYSTLDIFTMIFLGT